MSRTTPFGGRPDCVLSVESPGGAFRFVVRADRFL